MNWGGGGRSPSLTSLFSSVKGSLFSYFKSQFLILKKSFTLVELSIVLLVLALLVSTLLVGRQIIDRAKVQQVISEIDYYTKNFQMFRDQYDFLPGALDEANCRKYPEFSMQPGTDKSKYPSQCDDPDAMIAMSTNKYYTSYKQANKSMLDMVHSGLIENRSTGERRRKIYDIADTQETTCVKIKAVQSGFYKVKCGEPIGVVDTSIMYTCIWSTTGNSIKFEQNMYGNTTSTGGRTNCNVNSSSAFAMCNKNCSSENDYVSTTYGGKTYYSYYPCGVSFLPLSTYGKQLHPDSEKETICETTVIPGQKRSAYLLKKDEIIDNANRSTIGDKIWITYSSGNVDMNMTYGIGGQDNQIGFPDANVIVFFLFDEGKSELESDGAMNYGIYDLLNKKMNSSDKTNGRLLPISKSSGDGFNFAYKIGS